MNEDEKNGTVFGVKKAFIYSINQLIFGQIERIETVARVYVLENDTWK